MLQSAVSESLLKNPAETEDLDLGVLSNPEFFIETFGTVRTQNGVVPSLLIPWQRRYLHERTDRNIIEKSRDIRSSTVIVQSRVVDALWRGGDILIAANKEDNATNLLEIGRTFLLGLPFGIQLVKDNVTELEPRGFDFRMKAISRPTSARISGAGRSERCKHLICTEMAFWEWAEEYWASTSGAVTADGTVDIESTQNIIGTLFDQMLQEAKEGKNGFKYFGGLDWRVNPEHDAAWEAQKRKENSPRKFACEYECSATQAGGVFFEAEHLVLRSKRESWNCSAAVPGCLGELSRLCKPSELRIYQLPKEGRTYLAFADSATGTGEDYCCLVVEDYETAQEVLHLHGQWKPDVFAQKIDAIARLWRGRYAIERNHPGPAVIQECKRLGTPGLWKNPKDYDYGWVTSGGSGGSRRPMLDQFEQAVRLGECDIATQETLDEMRVFVFGNDGEPRAAAGYNDDRVIAHAGCHALRKQPRVWIA